MRTICKNIKDRLLCKYSQLFANITKLDELKVSKGVIELSGYDGVVNNHIVVCGDKYECDKDKVLASGLIHGVHQLATSNTMDTKFKYASFVAEGNHFVADNIRIMVIQSESHAFELFKANPNNYIFVTPIGSSTKQNDINQSIEKEEKYKIIIILYNTIDNHQFDNMHLCSIIEDDLIKNLMDTLIFRSSTYAFSTANTTILELVFTRDIILDYDKECDCYTMQLNVPFLKIDELVGINYNLVRPINK